MTISASAQRFAKLGESIYLENAGRALNVGTGSERSIDQLAWLVQRGGPTERDFARQGPTATWVDTTNGAGGWSQFHNWLASLAPEGLVASYFAS